MARHEAIVEVESVAYPYIEETPKGYIVHIGKRISLPGVYTTELMAWKAVAGYNGRMAEALAAKKAKKEKDA